MKCIIGLGNPGRKYDKTRHNIGFMAIDELLQRHLLSFDKEKFDARYTIAKINGNRTMFVQPETFMNLSGEAVKPLLDYYKIPLENIVVIYDDLDLRTGKIRLRQKGSHGGHNGVRSLIHHLQTEKFKRLRIGIGRPIGKMPIVDYVLSRFDDQEMDDVLQGVNEAADAIETWLEKPFVDVMTQYN